LAAMAQISPVTARRWLNGQREIPSKVAAAMETMLAAATALCSGGPANVAINLSHGWMPNDPLNEFDRQFLADIFAGTGSPQFSPSWLGCKLRRICRSGWLNRPLWRACG